jgi:hypothetical protein
MKLSWTKPTRVPILLALLVLVYGNALGQSSTSAPSNKIKAAVPADSPSNQPADPSPSSAKQQTDPAGKPKKAKRGQFVIAPIPIQSPAVGSGLVLVAGYVFKLNQDDKLSPPSTIGIAGARTRNGTRGGGIGGRFYFSENKYQTTFALVKGRVNFDYFGIGRIPGSEGVKVPLKAGGTVFFGEFLRNVWKDVFVGPRYQYRNLYAELNGIQTPGGFEVPAIDIKAKSVALGVHVQRDKRDSTFYPTKGSLVDLTGDFFDQAFGSRREYQTYKISYDGFHEIKKKQILAYRGTACSATGSVPFYDLCMYGVNSDLRGYTGGQFQNRRMFATQAEYRIELQKRFGVVAFGGIGGVARTLNEFSFDQLLPAGGAGLRFTLDKKNHINYRIDWAIGRAGHTLTIGIGEAF